MLKSKSILHVLVQSRLLLTVGTHICYLVNIIILIALIFFFQFGRYVLFGIGTVLIVRSTHMVINFMITLSHIHILYVDGSNGALGTPPSPSNFSHFHPVFDKKIIGFCHKLMG